MRDVYIIGVDTIKFGNHMDKSIKDLAIATATGCLKDAALIKNDIQALWFANAGWGEVAPIGAVTKSHFDKTFDLNAKGTFFTVQKAIPLFKDGGSIILTTSVANVMGLPTFAVYAATKAAVRSFVRSWAMELKDRNIRVNAVSPGPIETAALEKAGIPPEMMEKAIEGFTTQVPLGRRGKPEEIAAAVVFFASEESSYITGVELAVDGGMAQV